MERLCLDCPNDMAFEGNIQDDIQLCHACYNIDNLLKYGYVTSDELMEQFIINRKESE